MMKWVLRFKKMNNVAGPKSGTAQMKWKNKGRVHHEDNDGFYWRISFEKERYEDEEMICFSDYQLKGFKKTSNEKTIRDFIDEEVASFEKTTKEHESRKVKAGSAESVKQVAFESKPTRFFLNSDRKIMLKNEKRRKRSKRGGKVNGYSSRTKAMDECRIKGLEDMERTRRKMKSTKGIQDVFKFSSDGFAIVKNSFDPEADFKDSMMEMMMEKGIRQRDELEELLVCYLTLNRDEHHHLIVKVFQQTYNRFVNLLI